MRLLLDLGAQPVHEVLGGAVLGCALGDDRYHCGVPDQRDLLAPAVAAGLFNNVAFLIQSLTKPSSLLFQDVAAISADDTPLEQPDEDLTAY